MLDADFQAPDAYSDTERQIFDAALQVFARKGKDGARMQAIADRADINKAMLHYYFRSKDKLYEQVFAFTMRRFMASFGASLREAPPSRRRCAPSSTATSRSSATTNTPCG